MNSKHLEPRVELVSGTSVMLRNAGCVVLKTGHVCRYSVLMTSTFCEQATQVLIVYVTPPPNDFTPSNFYY